jgi:hypothetical protein
LIRIPIIADDTRFAATLAAYEARVRALNAQLAVIGATVGPGALVMQPGRRAVVAAVPRGSVQSPARAVGRESTTGGFATAAALSLGVAGALKSPPAFQRIDRAMADIYDNDPELNSLMKELKKDGSSRKHVKYIRKTLLRSHKQLKEFDRTHADQRSHEAFGSRVQTPESRARSHMRIMDRFDKYSTSYQLDDAGRTELRSDQNTTMARFNRRYSVAGRAKTLWRNRGNLNTAFESMGGTAVNTYRRINRSMRMIGGGATALSLGSIIPVAMKAQEERERLLHSGKYTPQAAIVGGLKLTLPDVATVAITTGMLAVEAQSLGVSSIPLLRGGLPGPFSLYSLIQGGVSPVDRAFGVTDYLRRLRGEMTYNDLRAHHHLQGEERATAEAKTMALRALEVGFSSGSGADLRSAYFAEVRPHWLARAEEEFNEALIGRKN